MRLDDLHADPSNRRTHPTRNVEMLTDALRTVGAARSIVIDEHDEVLAGNGVVAAAAVAGLTKVEVVEADGDTIVAVRRRGLSDEQKRALALYDNRTSELAAWDVEQLKLDAAAGLSLQPYWTEAELVELEVSPPGFAPVGADTQGHLDQSRQATCPECGHVFKV